MKTIIYGEESYEIPFKVTCNVTGLVKVYTLQSFIERRLEKFGGVKKFLDQYVCKEARQMLKLGIDKEEVIRTLVAKYPPKPKKEKDIKVEEVIEVEVIEKDERPVAKKDARGMWRDDRGRLIAKANLDSFNLVA